MRKKLFLACFSFLITLLLCEVGIRILLPKLPSAVQTNLRYVQRHPFTHETLLPPPAWFPVDRYQMVTQNNLDNALQYPNPNVGFHVTTKNWLDPESHVGFRVDSAAWEPRWPVDGVVVGDSFSFCFTEYDDCWVHLLETEYELSMVNLAQGATGSVSHLNLLLTFGLPYEPRFVVWQWYGNDFNEDAGFAGVVTSDETTIISSSPAWLEKNSTLFWLGKLVTGGHQNEAGFAVQVDPYSTTIGGEEMRFGRPYSIESADLSRPVNQAGAELSFNAILEAGQLLADQNIPLIIVIVPFKEEVYAGEMAEQLGGDVLEKLSSSRLAMVAFCTEHRLTCVDPIDELIVQKGETLYWANDTHLNGAGNRVLAEIVRPYLTSDAP